MNNETTPPIGPDIIGQEEFEKQEKAREARHGGTGSAAVPVGPDILGGAPAEAEAQGEAKAEGEGEAEAPAETLSSNEAIALISKHPEELAAVVASEVKRPGGARKTVLIAALKKARAEGLAELVEQLEELVED